MAQINRPVRQVPIYTHEGARAVPINPEQELRRSVMSCMLWENTFYENGENIATRIANLVPQVGFKKASEIAIYAREQMKLRHAPLWIVRAMAKMTGHEKTTPNKLGELDWIRRYSLGDTLARVIQRPDELTEFVALYWKDGRQPLSAQVKLGLASAFTKFDAYQLAKYNRDGAVKLRDVLFLCHAKPINDEQAATWKQLVDGTLPTPDTWEVALSTGQDKKETWTRLIQEGKLGALALLRNLRNMNEAKVDEQVIFAGLDSLKVDRVLPFRFIAAARAVPQWESKIEPIMLKSIDGKKKLPGKTILLIDVSGSMDDSISEKSDLKRVDAACGLAILARELCENVRIFSFSNELQPIPDRRGFALRDAIMNSQNHGGTWLGRAVSAIDGNESYDRFIVITDEQSHDSVPNPQGKGYMINVASDVNGVGYRAWTHIDGWSEAVLDYITESETVDQER